MAKAAGLEFIPASQLKKEAIKIRCLWDLLNKNLIHNSQISNNILPVLSHVR
jgi:hypothetical protein